MKNLILITFMMPAMATAQSRADYEKAMGRFVQYYNKNNTAKLATLFLPDSKDFVERAFGKASLDQNMKNYGRIKSFKYLGISQEDSVTVFKTEFEKQTVATSFTLEEGNKFGTFRFHTSSEEIDEMLRNAQ